MRNNQKGLKSLQRACTAIREVNFPPHTPKGWKSLERFEKQEVEDHGSQKDRYPRSGSSLTSVLHAHLWVFTPRSATLEESLFLHGGWALKEKGEAGTGEHTLFSGSSDGTLAAQVKVPLGRQ